MAALAAPRGTGIAIDAIVGALTRHWAAMKPCSCNRANPPVFSRTHADAPRVFSSQTAIWCRIGRRGNISPRSTGLGLMMYGQMTAGSWIYIGSQGIVQGTYETFVEMGRQHFGGNLAGKWILTGWPRRHGRRAATGRHACRRQHDRRRSPGKPDRKATGRPAMWTSVPTSIDEAHSPSLPQSHRSGQTPVSVGLLGNAAEIFPGNAGARHQARCRD